MRVPLGSHEASAPVLAHGRYRWTSTLSWIESHPTRFLLLVFVGVAAALALVPAVRGTLGMPPVHPDGFDYDNIAFNLAHGRGFRFDWDSPEWRAVYKQHDVNHRHLLPCTGSWPTAFRPPVLPLLIAGNHLLFGRQFVTVRISNVLFIAGALCLAATLAMRVIGPLGAVFVPVLGMADRGMLAYSGAILTESLALFSVVLLTWLLARLLDRPSAVNAGLAGAALGFAVLSRSIFILWYPLLTLAVFLLVRHGQPTRSKRHTLSLVTIFLGAAVVVPAPWWVWNCIVLDAFMPLGTQGGIALPGGYSIAAWKSARGHWAPPERWGLYEELERSEAYRDLPGHLRERAKARFGARNVSDWIKRNPEKLPVLAWRRLKDTLRPYGIYEKALFTLAFGGVLLKWRLPVVCLLAGLVPINALAVMATYSAGGRFLLPLKGSLYVLGAVGLVGLGRWLAGEIQRRKVRA